MRSKTKEEQDVEEFLEYKRFKYEYEQPVAVREDDKVRIFYPDFYLKEFGVYIEVVAFNKESDMAKEILYKKNGIEVIWIKKHLFPLPESWKKYIETYLKNHQENRLKALNLVLKR